MGKFKYHLLALILVLFMNAIIVIIYNGFMTNTTINVVYALLFTIILYAIVAFIIYCNRHLEILMFGMPCITIGAIVLYISNIVFHIPYYDFNNGLTFIITILYIIVPIAMVLVSSWKSRQPDTMTDKQKVQLYKYYYMVRLKVELCSNIVIDDDIIYNNEFVIETSDIRDLKSFKMTYIPYILLVLFVISAGFIQYDILYLSTNSVSQNMVLFVSIFQAISIFGIYFVVSMPIDYIMVHTKCILYSKYVLQKKGHEEIKEIYANSIRDLKTLIEPIIQNTPKEEITYEQNEKVIDAIWDYYCEKFCGEKALVAYLSGEKDE